MNFIAVMNGLVFLKVVAYAAPNGKSFSNIARVGAQKENCLILFQLQIVKHNLVLSYRLVFNSLVKWRMWLNINLLAAGCAVLLVPKWACV